MSMDTFYERSPERHQKETQIVRGVVAETATGFDDDVHVRVPDFHPRRKLGPCGWTPKWTPKGVFFPHKGDHCTVALTDEGDPEIIRWKKQKGARADHSGTTDEIADAIDDIQSGMDDLTGAHSVQPARYAQTLGSYDG